MDLIKSYPRQPKRVSLLASTHQRDQPPAPEKINLLLEHLNDPNYDLKVTFSQTSESLGFEDKNVHPPYSPADSDTESDPHSTSRDGTTTANDDESPYPEVRAAVSNFDHPTMPVNTFRMWFLGLIFTILVSGLNQVFSMRYPSVTITGIVVQLVALPLGKGLEKILPTTRFKTFSRTWSLNPGPFNIKEHVCITVMASVATGGAYATDIIAIQKIFYNQQVTLGYQILLATSTQVLGFSLGGLLRQFVVWPASMIWPSALVNSAFFNTLHNNFGKRDRGHMTRERFFCIALACSFVWYWVPGYLFTALSVFNWVCWIVPNNVVVNALFGTNTGLGMGIFTFDWSMIAFIGSPLVTPWWSEMNTAISFVVCFWVMAPILYFTNTFSTAHLAMSSYLSYDNTGAPYDPMAILTDGTFDVEKYRAYSPLYMSATLCIAYGVSFAAFASVLVHTFIWFRQDIVRRFRSTLKDEHDVHSRLMRVYPEVPTWWYSVVGIISFVLLIVAIHIYPTQLPIWGACIGFFVAIMLSVPLAMLLAITNQQMPLQVMAELIAGYMLPGRPIANVIFKTITHIGTYQAVTFAGDLKLGHYMKIPPRTMFSIQVIAAVVSCIVVTLAQGWMFANIVDICTPDQKDGFSCPNTNTFATASLIWGGIGPARLFSPHKMYAKLFWFFAVGALAPIPFYFLSHRYPLSFWRYVNIPVFFAGVGAIPPGSGINYASWAIVGFIFNYWIRRFHFRWWMRYNYLLSAALDAGVGLGIVVIFFTVQYPKGGFDINWWGNTVWTNTADALGTPLKAMNSGETFGPTTWS